MNSKGLKKIDESYIAVFLTFVIIGLLFLLKFQEEKFTKADYKTISSEVNEITYVE